MKDMLTGSFRDRESADRAYQKLREKGYKDNEIHMLMSEDTRKRHYKIDKKTGEVEMKEGNKALEGGAVGGAVGGAIGATLVGIAAAASTLAVPGLGLVIAGPLAGALAGGATGATAGGLTGLLVGAGIPEERAKLYENDVRAGHVVLGVQPHSAADSEDFEREWEREAQHVYR